MLILLSLAPATPASACLMASAGAKCISVAPIVRPVSAEAPVAAPAPAFAPGDVLPDGIYMVTGTAYLGLPPPRDGWIYFRDGARIYRAEARTRRVLGLVR